MSDFIKISVVILIVYCVWDYMKENNLTFSEMFIVHPHNSFDNSMENVNVTINNQKEYTYNDETNESINDSYNSSQSEYNHEIPKGSFQTEEVIIKPLGNVDNDDIVDAINIIQEFYGYSCVVGSYEPITEDMYINGTNQILDGDVCLNKFFSPKKVVYIVDKKLWAKGDYLRGYAARNGGTVIVRGEKSFLRETIIHELGHTLGLGHCDDLSCIMAVNNDEYDSGTFCKKCKRQLNIYE